jgi:hypothetical protein
VHATGGIRPAKKELILYLNKFRQISVISSPQPPVTRAVGRRDSEEKLQADRQSGVRQVKIRWIVANITGGGLGIGTGIAIAQGLLLWASRSPYYEETSGFPIGWSSYVALLIATLSGAMGAVIGYTLRQRLVQQRFVKKDATRYALAGAVLWPIIAALFGVVIVFMIAPLSQSLFPNAHGAAFDLVVLLNIVLATIVLALPVGLVVAMLRRKEAEW